MAAPVQWTSAAGGNDHWYEIVRDTTSPYLSWDEARVAAEGSSYLGMTGHLATLTSAAENAFVANPGFLGSSYGGIYGDLVWIGGHETAGGWNWVTGEAWSWTNWKPGQPSNGPGEDYLQLLITNFDMGQWNDRTLAGGSGSGYYTAYIIEYEASPVPVPAALWLMGSGLLGLAALRRRGGS